MTHTRMHALALAAIILAAPASARALDLQLMVPNLKPEQGPVVVSVYNDPAAWKAGGPAFRTAVVPVQDGRAVVRFDVPPGRYAAAVFQDRDGDGRLGALPFGWPTEPSGYSGVTRPMFGRPSWDRADFSVTEDERTTVFVRLK
jgi:uncharacterized protein (DUF2141 family)